MSSRSRPRPSGGQTVSWVAPAHLAKSWPGWGWIFLPASSAACGGASLFFFQGCLSRMTIGETAAAAARPYCQRAVRSRVPLGTVGGVPPTSTWWTDRRAATAYLLAAAHPFGGNVGGVRRRNWEIVSKLPLAAPPPPDNRCPSSCALAARNDIAAPELPQPVWGCTLCQTLGWGTSNRS